MSKYTIFCSVLERKFRANNKPYKVLSRHTTRDGIKLKYTEMSDKHLLNTERYFKRYDDPFDENEFPVYILDMEEKRIKRYTVKFNDNISLKDNELYYGEIVDDYCPSDPNIRDLIGLGLENIM